MGDTKTFVDQKIGSKRVVVFSKKSCPFCVKAKKTFQEYVGNVLPADEYEVVEIADLANCRAIQDYLKQLTGASSVPRVFINQKCIGGGDEVVANHKNGQLKTLMAA